MIDLTCEELVDLAPAFVLGALDDAEAEAVRTHLASCSDAHAEFDTLGGVVPYLAESVEQVEPPAGLKARILAAAAERERAGAERGSPGSDAAMAPAPPLVAPPASREPSAPPLPFPARRPTPVATWALGVAAVVAVVVLGGWSLVLQGRLDASERYAQGVAAVLALAAEPGSQTAIMSGGPGGATGIAAVAADGSIVLAMRDLAPTSGSEVYEAWVIAGDGGPVPVGGFTVGSDGTGTLRATGMTATPGATLALTREPAPGATAPTLPIVSSGVAVAPPG